MRWDSSMGYADRVGFRCGTCDAFRVFNVLTRQPLPLTERPLLVTDTGWAAEEDATEPGRCETVRRLLDTVNRYQGSFVFLWHNANVNKFHRPVFQKIYQGV